MNQKLKRALEHRGYLIAGNPTTNRFTLVDQSTKQVALYECSESDIVALLEASGRPLRSSGLPSKLDRPRDLNSIEKMHSFTKKAVRSTYFLESCLAAQTLERSKSGRESLLEDSNRQNVGIIPWSGYYKSRWNCNCNPSNLKSREIGRRLLVKNTYYTFSHPLLTTYTFQIFLGRAKLIEVELQLSTRWCEESGFSDVDTSFMRLWVSHSERFEGRDIPIDYNFRKQPTWDWKIALMEWLPNQDIPTEGLDRLRAMEVLSQM